MKIDDRSLVGAFVSIFSANVVDLVISVLFTPLLVRVLGADQYGDYAFVLSVLSLLMILANSGVTRGVKKYLPEQDRPSSWPSDVFGFYTRVSLLLVTVVCVPVFLLSYVDFLGLVDDTLVLSLRLMVIVVLCKQFYWLALNALRGLGHERRSEPLKILQRGSFATLALALAVLGYGVPGVLIAYAASLVLATVVATAYLTDAVAVRSVLRSHANLPRRRLLTFNGLSVVLMFLMVSLYNLDVVLLRYFTSDVATGYYKAALVVAQLTWLLPKALQTLLLHSTSNYWSAERLDEINAIGSLATRFTLVTSCLMAAGLLVLADDFMPVYFGSEFSAAVGPVLLLLPGVIGFAVARPMNAICQGSGDLRPLLAATGGAAGVNLLLNLLLIPVYGTAGAAVATSVGYGSMAVFATLASRSIGFDPVGNLRAPRIALSAAASTGVMYSIDRAVSNGYVSLAVIPVIGTAVYVVLVFRTGVITEDEARRITDRLPNLVASRTNRILSVIT